MPEKWWVRLSVCPSSLPVAPLPAKQKKKHKSQQQAAPFHLGFFFSSASYRSGFLDFVSTLFQVAGKEEDTDQRGVTAGGVRSDCGYCCCRWGLFGRW
jgi:hypothetical protein